MGTQTPGPRGELGKGMVQPLNWERSAVPGEFSLQQHRAQGSPGAETLGINCWDSSVSEPLHNCLSQPGVWLVGRGSPAPASSSIKSLLAVLEVLGIAQGLHGRAFGISNSQWFIIASCY